MGDEQKAVIAHRKSEKKNEIVLVKHLMLSMRGWNAFACRWRTVLTPLWTSTLTAWLSGSSRTTLEARWCSARPVEAGLHLLSWRISWGLRESHCFRLISRFWLHDPSSGQTQGSGGNCFSTRGNWPTATASGWWPPHRASYLRPSSSHRTRHHTALIYNSLGCFELDIFIWCICVFKTYVYTNQKIMYFLITCLNLVFDVSW